MATYEIYSNIFSIKNFTEIDLANNSYNNYLTVLLLDGQDFLSSSISPDLFFPAGSEEGALLCTNITILDDDIFEGDHDFSIHINSTSENIQVTEPQSATVFIIDDDGNVTYGLKVNLNHV